MTNAINKTRVNIKALDNLIKDLGRNVSIRVGIFGPKALEKVEGTDLNYAELGAVHEFGATINNPGGQPYYINTSTGMAVFVSKKSAFGQYLISKGQVTKPHRIVVPTRSFLRMPVLSPEGKSEIKKAVWKDEIIKESISNDRTLNKIAWQNKSDVLMEAMGFAIGKAAFDRVYGAFETDGYGNWKPTTPQSKKQRKYNPSAPTLVDSGKLKDKIYYEVKVTK